MRVLSFLSLVSIVWLPMTATAQTPAPPAQAPTAQKPAAPAPGNQTPAQPAQPAAPDAAPVERQPSLFDPTPRQFQVGARVSSISGDPARWQRYEDLGDGLLFTDARYERVWDATGRLFRVSADKVGWRDQRFAGLYELPGFLRVSGYWDEIPQFYSVDTATAYTSTEPGVLTMPDATQLAIQNGQANLNAYVPISPQFDLRERRDIGVAKFTISPSANLDLSATYRMQRHVGELPWGASFGFSNDVEVAAAVQLARQRFQHRRRMDQPASACCAWPTTGRGSKTMTPRSSGTVRCAATTEWSCRAGAACRCGRRTRPRP